MIDGHEYSVISSSAADSENTCVHNFRGNSLPRFYYDPVTHLIRDAEEAKQTLFVSLSCPAFCGPIHRDILAPGNVSGCCCSHILELFSCGRREKEREREGDKKLSLCVIINSSNFIESGTDLFLFILWLCDHVDSNLWTAIKCGPSSCRDY